MDYDGALVRGMLSIMRIIVSVGASIYQRHIKTTMTQLA